MTTLSSITDPISDDAVRVRATQFGKSKFGEKRGWKSEFAKALGFKTVQQLVNILDGNDSIGRKFYERMESLGCSKYWLRTGLVLTSLDNIPASDDDMMRIPLYHYKKGKTMTLSEPSVEYVTVKKSIDTTQYGVVAHDESMHPDIKKGDIVYFSEQRNIEDGVPHSITLKSKEHLIRNIKIDNGIYILSPINSQFEIRVVSKKDVVKIHRITESLRKW